MSGLLNPSVVMPDPDSDLRAQLAQVANPASSKDAMFVPPAALITTNPAKAKQFSKGPVDDEMMAKLLGYPETKRQAIGSGMPLSVQGIAGGGVAHEGLSSFGKLPAAIAAARAAVPGGQVRVTTPLAALIRRHNLLGL